MPRWAGLEICMGHAPDSVKAVADWITETNDQNGVAVAVRKLQDLGWLWRGQEIAKRETGV